MKFITPLLFIIALTSCNNPADKTQALQNRIDSLESKLAQTYDG